MCGIAGFVAVDDRLSDAVRAQVLASMCRTMVHRGPDAEGFLVAEGAALGMRRLSVIDVAGGQQPISNEDGTVTVVFNGEIYNHRDLRRRLSARGHSFRTQSDTEVIVHAYEQFGARCVDHFAGMFAFAVWDSHNRSLFIARDRVGEKPLYYTLTPHNTLVFGSELKSVLVHPEVRGEISPAAVDIYLSLGYVCDPLSIFRDIYKLPPGYCLTFAGGRLALSQYWDFHYDSAEPRSEQDYLEELRALLDDAVRTRLVADVPIGAFLSGGIDSSTVVGLMTRHVGQSVKTFSVGFREDGYDELQYARLASARFGTDHHELVVTPDLCDVVDELVWHLDEPFADPCVVPMYLVSKLARKHVTVVLSGDGGDELFAGYTRYITDRSRSGLARLPRFVRQSAMRPLSRRMPHGARGRNFLYNVSLDPVDRYIDSISIFTSLNAPLLYSGDFRRQLRHDEGVGPRLRQYALSVRSNQTLDAQLYIDSKTYLPGDILCKVDRTSMAASLEARAPLLDHKLIEAITRIPASLKLRGLRSKYILREAVDDLVPREILERPKQGFGVPMQSWLNQQLRERLYATLTDSRTRGRGYFETPYIQMLIEEHRRGRRDHSSGLWALMMLELWHRCYVDGPRHFGQQTVRADTDRFPGAGTTGIWAPPAPAPRPVRQ